MEDRNEQKLTFRRLVYFNSKKTSLKSEKKYKNHRQAEYHHTLKRKKKTLSSDVLGTRNLEPVFVKRVCYQLSYPSE